MQRDDLSEIEECVTVTVKKEFEDGEQWEVRVTARTAKEAIEQVYDALGEIEDFYRKP